MDLEGREGKKEKGKGREGKEKDIGVLDIDALVNLAIRLGNQMPRSLDEGVGSRDEEKVSTEDLLSLDEFLLRLLEVEVDIQGLDEVGDGVVVLVPLLPNNTGQVLQLLVVQARVAAAVAVRDDGGGEVAQDPGAVGLDGVDVGRGEEEVAEGVARGLVVEEGEERPVDQPGAVLQLRERVVEQFRVDGLFGFVDFLHRYLPVRRQDFGRELAPCGGCRLVRVGRLNAHQFAGLHG